MLKYNPLTDEINFIDGWLFFDNGEFSFDDNVSVTEIAMANNCDLCIRDGYYHIDGVDERNWEPEIEHLMVFLNKKLLEVA